MAAPDGTQQDYPVALRIPTTPVLISLDSGYGDDQIADVEWVVVDEQAADDALVKPAAPMSQPCPRAAVRCSSIFLQAVGSYARQEQCYRPGRVLSVVV